MIGDREAWEKVKRMEVESDHQSVSVWLGRRRERERTKRGEEWIEREMWTEEAREEFKVRT